MKWILGIVGVIIAGWMATVFVFNKTGEPTNLLVTDSLQAMAPVADSMALTSASLQMDSVRAGAGNKDTIARNELSLPEGNIDTKNAKPAEVVAYAKTLIGVPYLYGSTDPARGFDCSGFITYVFKHFGIVVPRSSIGFTNVGKEVSAADAREGDLILFTGTNPDERFVGHMGIVVSNTDTLQFIHSTSGRQYGVTITPLNDYYKGRYVKTVRIFP